MFLADRLEASNEDTDLDAPLADDPLSISTKTVEVDNGVTSRRISTTDAGRAPRDRGDVESLFSTPKDGPQNEVYEESGNAYSSDGYLKK
ncbi:unnamed protein product [Protopolystoma xenopodis]|uniref:Uncharacterized protein n=1 Tax=Protopolystoma xenopodis TaxID=117903 RepID=A0A3S5AYC6_9PLAT|nr:unnamed protein product [Protopolystoma xenopodis]